MRILSSRVLAGMPANVDAAIRAAVDGSSGNWDAKGGRTYFEKGAAPEASN